MKKLFCFLAISAMTLTSCSSDDDGGSSSGVILLKKTIEHYNDGTTATSTATYDGTKIKKITTDDGFALDFTYTGDLITKMEYKIAGMVLQIDTFTYNPSGQLTSYLRVEPMDDFGSKEMYSYNPDGSVLITAYSGDATSQTTLDGTGSIIFLPNGEVASINTDFSDDHSYTYDTKNNPFKNVTGYSKISWVGTEASGIMHNITNDDSFVDTTTTYTYNGNDYPETAVEMYDGEETTTEFFY